MEFKISEALKRKAGIYLIANSINDFVYVGSCIQFYKRYRIHRNALRKNSHHCQRLQRFFNKYGEGVLSFEFIEIISPATKDNLLKRENYYLKFYTNKFNSCPTAYSMQDFKFLPEQTQRKTASITKARNTPEQKKIQSDLAKNNWKDNAFRDKRAKSHKQAVTSQEYRDQMSKIVKERWKDKEYRDRVLKSKRKASNRPAYKEKVRLQMLGNNNHNSRIDLSTAKKIKTLLQTNTCKKTAQLMNVSINIVKDISRGRTWTHT